MKIRHLLLSCAVLTMAFSSGCAVMAARKAKDAFFGTRGTVRPIHVAQKDPAGYPHVILGEFTTDLEDEALCKTLDEIRSHLLRLINEEMNTKAFAAEDAAAGTPAICISGTLLDCDEGSKIGRATTFGGQAYIIMRYTVTDACTGETLAVFNSRGFIEGNIALGGEMKDVIPVLNYGVIRYLRGELCEMNGMGKE